MRGKEGGEYGGRRVEEYEGEESVEGYEREEGGGV